MTWIFLPSVRQSGHSLYWKLCKDLVAAGLDVAFVAMDRKRGGYWRALNRLIYRHRPERFIWLADDCEPKEYWLTNLLAHWNSNFHDNLGLAVCNDLVVKHGGASFAMTSPRWLYVLFGRPWFPKTFGHRFLDTLIADRSKDLGRYVFCENAVVEHKHHLFGKGENDEVYEANLKRGEGDKLVKDKMDNEWISGEKQKAQIRMEKEIKKHANARKTE